MNIECSDLMLVISTCKHFTLSRAANVAKLTD